MTAQILAHGQAKTSEREKAATAITRINLGWRPETKTADEGAEAETPDTTSAPDPDRSPDATVDSAGTHALDEAGTHALDEARGAADGGSERALPAVDDTLLDAQILEYLVGSMQVRRHRAWPPGQGRGMRVGDVARLKCCFRVIAVSTAARQCTHLCSLGVTPRPRRCTPPSSWAPYRVRWTGCVCTFPK